jgi:hypothetical protein
MDVGVAVGSPPVSWLGAVGDAHRAACLCRGVRAGSARGDAAVGRPIDLGSVFGLAAFVTGRLVQASSRCCRWPSASPSAAAARRWGAGAVAGPSRRLTAGLVLRRAVLGVSSVALIALAILVAQPASTDPILGADGKSLPGSVAELASVQIGARAGGDGPRTRDADNPVLLFLAGGPGSSEIGSMRNFQEGLEDDFVVAFVPRRLWSEPQAGEAGRDGRPGRRWRPSQWVSQHPADLPSPCGLGSDREHEPVVGQPVKSQPADRHRWRPCELGALDAIKRPRAPTRTYFACDVC